MIKIRALKTIYLYTGETLQAGQEHEFHEYEKGLPYKLVETSFAELIHDTYADAILQEEKNKIREQESQERHLKEIREERKKGKWQCGKCGYVSKELPNRCPDCKFHIFTNLDLIKSLNAQVEISAKYVEEVTFQREVGRLLALKDRDSATEMLRDRIENTTKFYATRFDEHNEMYCYDQGIYRANAKTFIKEFCLNSLGQMYTEQTANRVVAKIEVGNYIEQEKLLKRHYPDEIVVENGILNLRTRELSEWSKDKIFLQKIPIHYNPETDCPAIKKFFEEILPDENDVKTIEEFFGYCLMGGYPIQKITLFIGEGGNGKGQTLELLRQFLGEKNYCSIPLQKLEESEFKQYELFNKFANIGADISDQALKTTSVIKGLCGGDSQSASVKFKNDLEFKNQAKLIFSANKLPKTYDFTRAFFRRWVYIVFPYKFYTQTEYENLPEAEKKNAKVKIDDIIEKIITKQELTGLLNLALNGLDRLLKKGDFTTSKTSEETKKWWIRNSDSFLAFCREELEEFEDGWIGKKELRKAYGKFCRKNKIPAEGEKHIHEIMTREVKAWEDQDSDTGNRNWNGVRFREREFVLQDGLIEVKEKPVINQVYKLF